MKMFEIYTLHHFVTSEAHNQNKVQLEISVFQSLGIHWEMDLKIITGSGQSCVQAVHQDKPTLGA